MSGGGTSVLFDDFCAWALARGLDMDSADDVEGELTLRSQHKSSAEVAGSLATETAARMREIEERINAQDMQANARDRTAGLDMKSLHETLPTTGDEEHIERRARLFKRMGASHQSRCPRLLFSPPPPSPPIPLPPQPSSHPPLIFANACLASARSHACPRPPRPLPP